MGPENLIQWLRNPALLDGNSLYQLRMLLDAYPCFTVARILYLKNLLILNDLHYSNELIRTAMSVPDRRCLYYFMEDKHLPETDYALEQEINTGGGFSIIDRFLHTMDTDLVSADISTPLVPNKKIDSNDLVIENPEDGLLSTESVCMTNDEESFSLDYNSYLYQNPKLLSAKESNEPMPGQELIDAYLDCASQKETRFSMIESEKSERSGRQKVSSYVAEEVAGEAKSIMDLPDDTFTETLAKIYIKQKRYDKAVEIFRSLSLKYPEKNVYFADQIRYLEKLIYNIKKD